MKHNKESHADTTTSRRTLLVSPAVAGGPLHNEGLPFFEQRHPPFLKQANAVPDRLHEASYELRTLQQTGVD